MCHRVYYQKQMLQDEGHVYHHSGAQQLYPKPHHLKGEHDDSGTHTCP